MKSSNKLPYLPKVEVRLFADGKSVSFKDISSARKKRTVSGYELQTGCKHEETLDFTIKRSDGKEMDVDYLDILFTVPLLNFSKVILPDCGREYILRDKALYLRSLVTGVTAPNDGHPFVALVDQTGSLACSYGLLTYLKESTCRCLDPLLSARKALRGGHDVLTLGFRVPTSGWRYGRKKEISETVFLGGPAISWYHALRNYAETGKKLHKIKYPSNPEAWEPTWCTWTAWPSDKLNDKNVLENAKIAKHLGIKSIILDDGWFGPGLDTDTEPLNIGDYYPDPKKFPDLRGTIKKIQKLDMRALLWYAPTCIAPDSKAYSSRQHLVMHHQGKPVMAPNGFYNLCPCNPEVRKYVRSEIVRMMRDYGADGFKVDLYNTLPATPCDAKHEHDVSSVIDGVHLMMDDIWKMTINEKPDAILELKQNYGNFLAGQYGTMVRAGDTAYDSDSNLWRCFYIQAYAGVTHNDYLACSVLDTPRDISVMMIKQIMGGVPTFSMDLPRQPKQTIEVMRRWVEFYKRYLRLWQLPREPQTGIMDTWQILGKEEALVCALFAACEISLPKKRSIILLNATGRDKLYLRTSQPGTWQISRFNHEHEKRGTEVLKLKDGDSISIPAGGGAVMSNIS